MYNLSIQSENTIKVTHLSVPILQLLLQYSYCIFQALRLTLSQNTVKKWPKECVCSERLYLVSTHRMLSAGTVMTGPFLTQQIKSQGGILQCFTASSR